MYQVSALCAKNYPTYGVFNNWGGVPLHWPPPIFPAVTRDLTIYICTKFQQTGPKNVQDMAFLKLGKWVG